MLDESHRDFVRFLYFKDLDDLCSAKIKDPENIAIYRVSRVLFGLSSSPLFVIWHAYAYASFDPELLCILSNLYT